MKKLTNSPVAFVATKLATLQTRASQPISINSDEKFITGADADFLLLAGANYDLVAKQIIDLVEQYRPAAAAYLMRANIRAGRVEDAVRAGKLSEHSTRIEGSSIRIGCYHHEPTKRALLRFLQPKIDALIAAENKQREIALAEYVSKISGEIVPPDPQQEAPATPAPAPTTIEIAETEEIAPVELPADLA